MGCRGPASREQQFSVKGKLRLVLSKRSIWRGQRSEGGEWRPAMRSPAFIYNLSFCRKKGSKAGGSCPDRRVPAPCPALPRPAARAQTWCLSSDCPSGSVCPPAAPSTESGASCAEAGGARRGEGSTAGRAAPKRPLANAIFRPMVPQHGLKPGREPGRRLGKVATPWPKCSCRKTLPVEGAPQAMAVPTCPPVGTAGPGGGLCWGTHASPSVSRFGIPQAQRPMEVCARRRVQPSLALQSGTLERVTSSTSG